MAAKTIEELEEQMNRERVERNRRMAAKLDREQRREKPRRRFFPKLLLLVCLLLAALLFLAWMVLQRTQIYIGLGAVSIPGLTG